jgi:hypothetical protein
MSGPQETGFLSISPARSRWTAPGRIGFMSTQRRESRSTPATKTSRWGPRYRWRRTSCTSRAGVSGEVFPASIARIGCADASDGTAPPVFLANFHPSDVDLSPGTPVRLATNSLQSGYRIVQLVQVFLLVQVVQVVLQNSRRSAPPLWAGSGTATGTSANHRSPLPRIPFPSGHAPFHPSLPRVPAG